LQTMDYSYPTLYPSIDRENFKTLKDTNEDFLFNIGDICED